MSLQKQIEDIFKEKPVQEFDPAEILSRTQQLLESHYVEGGAGDPRNESKAVTACNDYGFASHLFFTNGFRTAAETILLRGWARFCSIQQAEKKRVYKAGIAMYLTHMYLRMSDRGAAFRWALLTQIEDLFGRHSGGGGAGRQLLQTALGMSPEALQELRSITEINLELLVNKFNEDWSSYAAFSEDVIVRVVLQNPEWSHLFALPTAIYEYPLNTSYFAGLIRVQPSTSQEKGEIYEDIASYLTTLVPGWLPRRNLLDTKMAFETDIVVRNLNQASNLTADMLGRHFIMECKNWEKPVGVRDIGYFLYRIRLTHGTFGIIFSREGITGDGNEERASYSLIRKAFHEDGITCIVINEDDLVRLGTGNISFWTMILKKMETSRFGSPRN